MSKYRTNIKWLALLGCMVLWAFSGFAADAFPERQVPPRLVNDFTQLLTADQTDRLEQKLRAYNDSTSTQIALVSVADLGGYDVSDYAFQLAEKWGIGQKGKNNGILVLIKPKNENGSGKIFIATGYGMEERVPDAYCKRIIEEQIIPAFRQQDYYGGLDQATTTLIQLASGTYKASAKKEGSGSGFFIGMILVFLIVFFLLKAFLGRGNDEDDHFTTGGRRNRVADTLFTAAIFSSLMNSGRSSGGGFSDGGSFGGGGGFGGFGGGSFGGGGAGGSW